MAAITLDIGGNTRQLDRDIQKTVNKVYSINLKTKGDQPLGRITGQVNEFTKSLDASNARVIAFGASAGIIFGLEKAFNALVSSTIEVQKSLQDINVILNVSTQQLNKFGSELFSIAKNTGQSFQEVAKAATEFSRQGLGVEETLKRTNEALILSRLSGLDAAKSVEALTAAVNSFASQAVTASEVVNKFANVDAAFAVSSADLAEAISRVGSSAAQSGVSLNELIAIVTSAQQTTARGGAVIGNSFKTIFTRLERGKVQDLLGSLGISTTDSSGQLKSTIQLLQDLGNVYDTLGSQQQAYVAEQVGGVFQINILKAALADLGKEYSIYNSALNVAAGSTDQAIRRNEELNKTYAAQINVLTENAKQLAATAGERLLGPAFERVVGGANTILGGINESDGTGIGATLGKGILDGLGQFIAGPGLALLGGVLIKLFRDLGKFATGSVQQLLGLNTAATQQRDLQTSIQQILSKNPQLLQLALQGEQGLNQAANSLLASLQKQTIELQRQAQVAAQISKAFISQAGVRVTGGVPVVPTGRGKASGFIPNFASDKQIEKAQAVALGATSSVRPHMSKGTIGGRKFVMNNQETEYPGVGKNGDSMVIPHYAARGFVPNFQQDKQTPKEIIVSGAKKYGYLIPSTAPGRLSTPDKPIPGGVVTDTANNIKYVFPPQTAYGPKLIGEAESSNKLENQIYQSVLNRTASYTKKLAPPGKQVSPSDLEKGFQSAKGAKGAILSAIGAAFEVGITTALGYEAASTNIGAGDFDVRAGKGIEKIQSLFGIGGIAKADFKATTGVDSVTSFRKKILREEYGFGGTKRKTGLTGKQLRERGLTRGFKGKAFGYIPNFAALQDAISRERTAGVPSSKIYIGQDRRLAASGYNPLGLGVFNTRDEPTAGSRSRAIKSRGYASGYIPNFADDTTNVNSSVAALGVELVGLSYILAGSRQRYKESFDAMQSASKATKRFAAGADAYGSAIAIGAPILAATIKNAIPQTTKGGRGAAAAVTGVGQVLSMGATGAQLGLAFGPQGAAVGAALGALAGTALSANDVIKGFTSTLPDAQNAYEKASQELTKFNDASQKLTQASEKLKNALSESVPDPKKVKQAQDEYADTLSEFSESDRKRITSAKSPEEEKAIQERIRSEKEAAEKNAARNVKVSELYEKSSSIGGKGSRLFYTGTGSPGEKAAAEANKAILKEAFLGNVLQGKKGSEALPVLKGLQESGIVKELMKLGSTRDKRSVEERSVDLKGILEKSLPESEFKAGFIADIINTAETGFLNLQGTVFTLASSISDATIKTEENVNASNKYAAAKTEEARKLDEANRASKTTISIIQQSIRTAQQQAAVERTLRDVRQKFAASNKYEDQLRSTETVKQLVGDEAPLSQRFENRSEIARLNKEFTSGINDLTSTIATELSNEVGSLFQTSVSQTAEKAKGQEGASADQIRAATQEAQSQSEKQIQAFNEFQKILSSNIEGNKNLNFDSLKQVFEQKLTDMGIIGENQTSIISKLESSVNSGNVTIAKLQEEAKQGILKLAKEATQKILIQKIGQAQKFAGGIQEFLNPPEPGESTFDKAIQATKGFDQFEGQKADFRFDYIPGTSQYKYQYPEAEKARREMAPERGRKSLNLIGGLQDYFGYTPDASGKAYQAGVEGVKENLDRQVAEFQKIADNPKTPDIVRDEITNALKEVQSLGGTRNIAEIQVAKETGALTEAGFQKITGKFNDPVLETLRQQNPELASMKAAEMIVSDDPTVNAINKTNSILTDIKNNTSPNNSIANATQQAVQDAVKTGTTPVLTQAQGKTQTSKSPMPDGIYNNETGFRTFGQINQEKNLAGTQEILGPNLGLGSTSYINGVKQNPEERMGIYEPTSLNKQRNITSSITSLSDIQERNFAPGRKLNEIKSDVSLASYDMDIKRRGLYAGNIGEELAKRKPQQDLLWSLPKNTTNQGTEMTSQQLKLNPQSFTQQEASFNSNTSALTTLNGGIETLNSTLSNLGGNINNTQQIGAQTATNPQGQTVGQPNVTTTTNAPVNVVVNAQGGDIGAAVGQAVQNAIPTIIEKVRIALGEKVPPTSSTPKQ